MPETKMKTVVISFEVPDDGPDGYGVNATAQVMKAFQNIAFTRNPTLYLDPPAVVVGVEGGIIQGASSEFPLNVIVLDYDTEGSADAQIVEQAAAPDTEACVSGFISETSVHQVKWAQSIANGTGIRDQEQGDPS